MPKPGNGSIEDSIEQRFHSKRASRNFAPGRKVPKGVLFIINAVLIGFMIFLVRSKDAGPEYHTATLQAPGITYRFSLGRSKGAPYNAALSLKADSNNSRPIFFTKFLARLTVYHGDVKLLEQEIEAPSGRMMIAPGEEKSVAVELRTADIDSYYTANPGKIPEVVRVPFVPTIITVPLTAKITVPVPENKHFSLTFRYEVRQ
jgi:hypothetical protein